MLREAVLYQYIFLVSQVEGETGEPHRPNPARLQSLLAQAVHHPYDWLGAPLAAGAPAIDLPAPSPRRAAQRLYPPAGESSQWRLHGSAAAYADVQLSNSTLSLQLAYACPGQADDDVRKRLTDAPWALPDDDAILLGQTHCFGGRVPDLAAAIAAAEAFLLTDPSQPRPLRRTDLPLGDAGAGWLFDCPGPGSESGRRPPDRLAFFYPDTDDAERLASTLFNTVLPDLALSLHKVAHQYGRGYEQGLRPLLAAKERSLADVLARALPPPEGSEPLDLQLQELARVYNDFAADLATFDRLAQAVRVNLANLQAAFSEYDLPHTGCLAPRLTAAERAVQQLAADRGFYQARVQQAEMAISALHVQAEIERNRIEQEETRQGERRNLLLGFIAAVLALGQIVNDAVVIAFWGWLLAFFGRTPLDPMPAAITFVVKLLLVFGISLVGVGLAWGAGRLWRRLRRPQP